MAAMQETLSQLSELNNEAIVESSRTARKLTDEHFGVGRWAVMGGWLMARARVRR